MLRLGHVCALLFLSALIVGCASADENGFAIYLLKERMTGVQAQKVALDALPIGERIIATGDIVSYSQASNEIELTPQAYARVQALFKPPVQVAGIPFIACVGNQRIYMGAFWTFVSSQSFDGVVILQPFAGDRRIVRIDLGYPGPAGLTRDDPRADPRILESLAKAGKLKAGLPNYRLRIRNSGTIPIKGLVVVFPDDRISYGDVEAGATTDYRVVPHGVFTYAAYEFAADGKVILQPVVDWVGEKPLVGEDFTYTIDKDPARAPAPQIRLSDVQRDK